MRLQGRTDLRGRAQEAVDKSGGAWDLEVIPETPEDRSHPRHPNRELMKGKRAGK